MSQQKIIGIIGGMGPYASLDLHKKIMDNTRAASDQEHLPIAHLSFPDRISDRSSYLLGESEDNPVDMLTDIATKLIDLGAQYIVLPCNTAHHPKLFPAVEKRVRASGREAQFLSLLQETARHISRHTDVQRVGVLSSLATFRFQLYVDELKDEGLESVLPDEKVQRDVINPVIFHPEWGVKAISRPVHDEARRHLLEGADHLRDKGAEAVILGCTEFPLVITDGSADGLPAFDPTLILARRLVELVAPEKLRAADEAAPAG